MRPPAVWTIAGIPVHIAPSWFVIILFVSWSLATGYFPARASGLPGLTYWTMGFMAALLLFACVLLHELGHALTAQRFGIPVLGMTLFLFGGVAQLANDPKRPLVELLVALAGPAVSAALGAGCFFAARAIPVTRDVHLILAAILEYLAMINLGLILFNLLPGFPLDGGRVLRAALWGATGNLRTATRISSAVGSWLGLGLLALGVWSMVRGAGLHGLWYVLLGMFLRDAARATYHAAAERTPR
ncbi:MAG: site-2 protease family protein [Candidatus Omnitrophica bacterium]|nr:site-2 protease family protein [Candidatus Omnitrophota bacterium]